MPTGKGKVLEVILEEGCRHVRVACAAALIPSPGQYLLASDGSEAPLPVPLFHTDYAPQGFLHGTASLVAAGPVPGWWMPGLELFLQGPLGHGFTLPLTARRVGLVAFDDSSARLRGLIRPALKQDAAVVLVCGATPEALPDAVEVQPLSALGEIIAWADYLAIDVARESLPLLRERLGKPVHLTAGADILVRTPVPCGGIADCGVCAVKLGSDWKLACKEGPVFRWGE